LNGPDGRSGARSLLLAASFRPATGGVETLLYETSRRLEPPPLVLAPSPAAAPDLTVQAVAMPILARVAYRPAWRLHPGLHYLNVFLAPTLRAAHQTRPDVVQAGHVYLAPLARLVAHRLGVPYVVYAYGQEVWRGGRPMGSPRLDQVLRGEALRAADRVLVPGSFTAGLLRDWHVGCERIVPVPYGAEPHPDAKPPTGHTLLTVGRLVPRKGVDVVLYALRLLPAHVAYRVVGGGPDDERLRRLAAELGVADRVTFTGRVESGQLADEYRRCAIYVQPSRRTADGELEGYGLVYSEAAAWGRPVVAGRSGGEGDVVVDGETGVLVDGTSVREVADALQTLLVDPERMQQLGAAGRRRVETTHTWTRAASVVDATLAQVR
jgi:phosphatidylinositol alpha-1,6-mannosyltransferase